MKRVLSIDNTLIKLGIKMKKRQTLLKLLALTLYSGTSFGDTLKLVTTDSPPYTYEHHPDRGAMTKIVEKAFKNRNHKISITYKPWARMLTEASTGRYDGILMLPYSTENNRAYFFSTPILNTRIGFAMTEECHGKTESPLHWHNVEIGCVKDYLSPGVFEKNAEKTLTISDNITGLRMLAAKRIKLLLIDENNFNAQKNNTTIPQNRELRFCQTILEKIPLHLALRRSLPNAEKTIREFNTEIMKLQSSGYIASVINRTGIKQ